MTRLHARPVFAGTFSGCLTLNVKPKGNHGDQASESSDALSHFTNSDSARGNEEKWYVQLGLIQARPVAEDAAMLAEAFAVVRGNDQPGSLENSPPGELVDQPPELLVEVGDAIVISVDGEGQVLWHETNLVQVSPAPAYDVAPWVLIDAMTYGRG